MFEVSVYVRICRMKEHFKYVVTDLTKDGILNHLIKKKKLQNSNKSCHFQSSMWAALLGIPPWLSHLNSLTIPQAKYRDPSSMRK